MSVYCCSAKITNVKYTLPMGQFEVVASSWPVAAHRATFHALTLYKRVRGRRDRPIEVEVTVRQRPAPGHISIIEEPNA